MICTGIRKKTCLKMYKKVHFILEMTLEKNKEKNLRVSPSTWPQEGAHAPRDPRMALAVSGNNGQEPGQISDVIIISCCHL